MSKLGRKPINAIDAKEAKPLLLLPRHNTRAVQRDQQDCVLAKCLKKDHGATQVHILRNTAYVSFGEGKVRRYILSAQTRLAICQFDTTGKWPIPGDGVHVVLRPPTGVRKLSNLRSKEFKELRRKSYEKNKGKPKRLHRTTDGITAEAIRSGVGYHIK